MRLSLAYFICCAERTGSTLLSDALISTGLAGRPRSYFNRVAHFNPRYQRILGSAKDDDQYLDKVIAAATTPNGVFGAKVHWEHFINFITKVDRSLAPQSTAALSVHQRIQLRFPSLRYIWLTRRNAVARAISHYRAEKTGRWQVDARWFTDDTGGEGEPPFDFDAINAFVQAGKVENANWRRYFQEEAISPFELTHEEVLQDPTATVRQVLQFLGVQAGNLELPSPSLRQQADGRSREWERRYRRMCAEEDI